MEVEDSVHKRLKIYFQRRQQVATVYDFLLNKNTALPVVA